MEVHFSKGFQNGESIAKEVRMFIKIQGVMYNLSSFRRIFQPGKGFLQIETDIEYAGERAEIKILEESQKGSVESGIANYVVVKNDDFRKLTAFLEQKTELTIGTSE